MKKFLLITLTISVVAIFLLYGGYSSAIRYALNPAGSDRITVTVPEGATGSDVASLLYEKKLIKSVSAFNFYLRQSDLSDQLKAGRFVFQENFTMPEIVDILAEGKSSEFAVTLLEGSFGWTTAVLAAGTLG